MGLNFKNISKNKAQSTVDPKKIFDILPNKSVKYDGYLRDVQTEVLKSWMEKGRNKKDTILKMNTGSGKTVVGLLILKSYLNENKGPVAYFVPDNYLLSQVINEAKDLNLTVTSEPSDISFLRGRAILVTNIHRLVNGKSVFGIDEKKINLGALIIDDAHGCIDICRNQVSLFIPRQEDTFVEDFFLKIRPSLVQQSNNKVLMFEEYESVSIPIPFWALQKNISYLQKEIRNFADHKGSNYQKSAAFNMPLLLDRLHMSDAFFTEWGLTISLRYAPVDQILSFSECPHRIFMSATIEDESTMVSQFSLNTNYEIISPKGANDIGERLILTPQATNPKISSFDIKEFIFDKGRNHNIVVLVPNYKKAREWEGYHDYIQTEEDDVSEIVERLKNRHIGVTVIVARYDGIDLPKKACEILIIDGIPDPKSQLEKFDQKILRGTKQVEQKMIRVIEQGMGRGIRSKEDYCVILLMGTDLIKSLYVNNALEYFSPATREQLKLSEELLEDQDKDSPISAYEDAIDTVLSRDDEWITTSKEYLSEVEYNNKKHKNEFEEMAKALYLTALQMTSIDEILSKEKNILSDFKNQPNEKGYLNYFLAKFINKYNEVKAQELIKVANNLNSQIIRPIEGIRYEKRNIPNLSQSANVQKYIHEKYESPNDFLIDINSLLDNLIFDTKYSTFENTFFELGKLLGYSSQTPENSYGQGPDNLWLINGKNNFIVECKNEAETSEISKSDCNQMNGSIEWFKNIYPDHEHTPILIHKSKVFDFSSSPNRKIRIINEELLVKLKDNAQKFCDAIATDSFDRLSIENNLRQYFLSNDMFIEYYTTSFKKRKTLG
ncbi:DEAD/DEAH box helicase family protein [Enterococcus sp. BWT-B8]|uniref:DEAD/DEAH box helicase family protein n=1 Tax=Enterococcus sp. BWT-B8 TaxID=2885157 RepID=UPI001E360A8F|nr:DEAD/DEAH box helicase family protein [Enterococcus sp. BWT-B8]MCB5953346.1 DEAD/DEAH box helicase family protein [Enterococcus sp. BWT-B8]